MKADVTTLAAAKAGTIELADGIFGLEPRADILHRMVNYQMAKRQAGTHATKGRSDIKTTKKKMYRQKGTGSARHGAKSAPQFKGGGVAMGPKPRSHAIDLPKKVRTLALKHALSSKAKASELIVLEDAKADAPKTKGVRDTLKNLGLTSALIIDGAEVDTNLSLAIRSIPNVDLLPVQGINVYDILRRDKLVLTKSAVEALEARLA